MVEMNNTEKKITETLKAKADSSKNEELASATKAKSVGNITVFCAIPMGIKLRLPSGDISLNGVPMSHIVSANVGEGYLPAGKYGETVVTDSQWEEILAKYSKYDFIVNGTIFAKERIEEGREVAQEKSVNNMGFDQADPSDKKKSRTRKKSKED